MHSLELDERTLSEIDRLQIRYIHALDRRDLAAWLGCFAKVAGYTCISAENVEQGLSLAIMLDDCRERLLDRIKFIEEVWVGTFEEYKTRHFVQRLTCETVANGTYIVESNVLVSYTTAQGRSDILVAGCYHDEVRVDSTGAAFVSKRAILDTVATPRYLVYPV